MGRVIGVIVRLNLHPDPAQCTAVFIGLRWKNPRVIGHRNVIRDHWDHSIIGRAEHPSFPACPSHTPRHYSLLGSGLWNTQKVPLPPDFSILPPNPRKSGRSTKAGKASFRPIKASSHHDSVERPKTQAASAEM